MSEISRVLKVQVRSAYGQRRIYPISREAKLLARLTGKRTFSPVDLDLLREVGFELEWVPESLEPREVGD